MDIIMNARLPPHSHCLVCEEPVPEGERFCSEACQAAKAAEDRKEARRWYVFYGVAIVVMIIIFVVPMLLG